MLEVYMDALELWLILLTEVEGWLAGMGAGLVRGAGTALTGGGVETLAGVTGTVTDLATSALAFAAFCSSLRFLALSSQKLTLGRRWFVQWVARTSCEICRMVSLAVAASCVSVGKFSTVLGKMRQTALHALWVSRAEFKRMKKTT
ncbi:hypothetical protein TNCV_3178291 [Trichonephila clavipes]|nr:hypothetical protein TNCV_3178291 [Trichonephila clavipes]